MAPLPVQVVDWGLTHHRLFAAAAMGPSHLARTLPCESPAQRARPGHTTVDKLGSQNANLWRSCSSSLNHKHALLCPKGELAQVWD